MKGALGLLWSVLLLGDSRIGFSVRLNRCAACQHASAVGAGDRIEISGSVVSSDLIESSMKSAAMMRGRSVVWMMLARSAMCASPVGFQYRDCNAVSS